MRVINACSPLLEQKCAERNLTKIVRILSEVSCIDAILKTFLKQEGSCTYGVFIDWLGCVVLLENNI
jgi:hypothetical protein